MPLWVLWAPRVVDQDGDGMWDYNNPNNAYPNVNGFYIAGDGLAGNFQQLVPDWAHFESLVQEFCVDELLKGLL